MTNLLFHTANTLLLFLVLGRMTGALGRSAFVAALFAWHPLHVESVAWVSERKDLLSAFFGFLSIWAYACYAGKSKVQSLKSEVTADAATRNATRNTLHVSCFTPSSILHPPASFCYLLALLLFALSLMSKPMLVTLPFVLLLLDYWPLRRLSFPTLHHSNPPPLRLLLSRSCHSSPWPLLRAWLSFLVQRAASSVVPLDHYPFAARLVYAIMGYWGYLRTPAFGPPV